MSLQEWFESRLPDADEDPEFQLEKLLLRVNEQICEAMERQGLSKADLARKLGVSRAWVTRLLNGKPNITLRTLVEVTMALGLRVNVALGEPEKRKAKRPAAVVPARRRAKVAASAVAEPRAKYGRKNARTGS